MFALAPATLTPDSIVHSFGRLCAEQGAACADGVELLSVEALTAPDWELNAVVRDGRGRRFDTTLLYQPEHDWTLSGSCTCSAGGDCAHCAALAWAWLAIKPAPVASPVQVQSWLAALEHSTRPAAEAAASAALTQLAYALSLRPGEPAGIQVQVGLRSRQPGPADAPRWRKWHPLSPAELLAHPLAAPADQDVAALLLGLHAAQQSVPETGLLVRGAGRGLGPRRERHSETPSLLLTGSTGPVLLEQILATGRAYARNAAGELQTQPLQRAPALALTLQWQTLPTGYRLSLELPSGNARLAVVGAQALAADWQANTLAPVDLAPAQLELLLQAPVLSPAELARVGPALLALLPALPLPADLGFHEVEIADAPVPVLTLQGESPQLQVALLHFDYGGQSLPARAESPLTPASAAAQPAETRVTQVVGTTVYRIQRAPLSEARARHQLLQTGLLPLQDAPERFGFAAETTARYLQDWHHWLHTSLPDLRAQGWRVEIAPSFRLAFVTSPAWTAALSASGPEQKWFSLSLGIEVDGERVELLPLLLRLLKTVPDPRAMREQLEQHSNWLLPLDPEPLALWAAKSRQQELPQRWLSVPSRRLARMLDLLVELYDYLPSSEEPEQLQLSAFAALQLRSQVRLGPNDYGVSWEAPPALEAAAERLAGRPQDGLTEIPLPAGLQATLRPYQQRGLNWLQTLRELGLNGILADDMGLGKTLQTLAHLLAEHEAGRLDQPVLVVMPTSVLGTWEREAARFAPGLRCLLLHGPERPRSPGVWQAHDLILTSYTLFRQDAALHGQMGYSWLILDEAQQIKNPRAHTSRLLCAQPARHRLCLSGTPIENQLEELWSLFHFLMPGFLDTLERFNSRFRHPIERTGDTRRLESLRERVRPLMLRRRKREVVHELPPKTDIVRSIELGTAQRDLYETTRLAVDVRVNRLIREQGFKRSRLVILDALLKLRQICCHPHLLDLPEAQKIRRSAKLEVLMELVPELVQAGRRILIFSQFVKMLDLIAPRLHAAEIPFVSLTGRTRQRQAVIDRFQNGEVPVFLISLKAGGVGLNLTAADTVIHYDPWWNPATEQQATDRAWRIGQTQPVFVYRLITQGTVEERILALQASKQALSDGIFGADAASLRSESLLALLQGQDGV
ncbi:MAG: SNF2-related protein [Candidatus Sericytochromatia bacterium]